MTYSPKTSNSYTIKVITKESTTKGSHKGKIFSVYGLAMILLLAVPCIADSGKESANYCKDADSWKEWNELLAKYPQDDAICALYATRRGLCTMVESRMIDLDRATRIFEDIRESLVENYRDQSGPKEKKQAL